MKPETLAAQALHAIDDTTGAIVPPVHFATTFARDASYGLRGPMYSRDENPTPVLAEKLLAALEGGAGALVFSSGMAAVAAAFRALLSPGAHVIGPACGYFALRAWMARFCAQWQVQLDMVDTSDLDALSRALRPGVTRLVWIESPANPTWELTDLAAASERAHAAGALVIVDATAATPVHTRALDHGVDIVMHSATKYLGGHSDVLAGALVTRTLDDAWADIARVRHDEGPVLGPMEAYLLIRGMRTLFARVERSSKTALSLAERLATLPGVSVRYPGLPSHPQHAIARRQMERGFGSMLSIQTGGGAETAIGVMKRLRVWMPATSLGGVESLAEHRFTLEGPVTPTPPDLIRLSVGLEHEDDLFEDLRQALAAR